MTPGLPHLEDKAAIQWPNSEQRPLEVSSPGDGWDSCNWEIAPQCYLRLRWDEAFQLIMEPSAADAQSNNLASLIFAKTNQVLQSAAKEPPNVDHQRFMKEIRVRRAIA